MIPGPNFFVTSWFCTNPWETDQGDAFPPGWWICTLQADGKTVEWIKLPWEGTTVEPDGSFLRILHHTGPDRRHRKMLLLPAHRVIRTLGVAPTPAQQ